MSKKIKEGKALDSTSSVSISPGAFELSRSASSSSRKNLKLPKPVLLKLNKADPKLKIRPYIKSKVTFSDQTESKEEPKNSQSMYQLNEIAASQMSSYVRSTSNLSEPLYVHIDDIDDNHQDETQISNDYQNLKHIPDTSRLHPMHFARDMSIKNSHSHEISIRRQSYAGNDECIEDNSIGGTLDTEKNEYWLRHQSLPNIQEKMEEDQSSLSKQEEVQMLSKDEGRCSSSALSSRKTSANEKQKQLSRQFEISESNAEEKRYLFSKASESDSDSFHDSLNMGKVILSKKANKLFNSSKQSSSESESGSYVTVCSVFPQLAEDDKDKNINKLSSNSSSSLSSFFSAKESQINEDKVIKITLCQNLCQNSTTETSNPVASNLDLYSEEKDENKSYYVTSNVDVTEASNVTVKRDDDDDKEDDELEVSERENQDGKVPKR